MDGKYLAATQVVVPLCATNLHVESSLENNKLVIVNGAHACRILTDGQALILAYQGIGGIT